MSRASLASLTRTPVPVSVPVPLNPQMTPEQQGAILQRMQQEAQAAMFQQMLQVRPPSPCHSAPSLQIRVSPPHTAHRTL